MVSRSKGVTFRDSREALPASRCLQGVGREASVFDFQLSKMPAPNGRTVVSLLVEI